ncbi:MAG: carbohydrate kinase family protein [Candidatus Pacebacteria bacterium]|nr:carbohydrate kinase family protein [Candidatus Paceibacterota bacterium]
MMFDVIAFGSATWDISLDLPKARIKKETDLIVDEGLLLNIGSKINIDGFNTNFGGGGVNVATTFSNQGFRVAYCGAIGDDIGGREIVNYLKSKKINTSLLKIAQGKKTNTSVVLKIPQRDRTILVYRGASDCLSKEDFSWNKLSAKWFYLAPLSGKLSLLTEEIVLNAKKKGIKVAMNLGSNQLIFPKKKLSSILKSVDVVFVNLEEASVLTGLNYCDEKGIVEKVKGLTDGIIVITKGGDGVVVISDGKVFRAFLPKVRPVDNTGAGDAFGSGFISSLLRDEKDIEMATKVGMFNAKSCILEPGSTNGLLSIGFEKALKKEKFKIVF